MHIKKEKVGSSTRKLSAKYTIDLSEEIEHIMGNELQKAIDDEVMNAIVGPTLLEKGWTQVVIDAWADVDEEWLKNNLAGKHSYTCFGHFWYFEKESDATMFKLRWC
jgi:hypothetical protein